MYGEETLTNHYALRFSLTKEFFETFPDLTYLDLELPLCLIRQFQNWMKPFVNENVLNSDLITEMKTKHRLYRMSDVQKKLQRNPIMTKDLSLDSNRKSVMMPARFLPFALEHFIDAPVVLMVLNRHDKKALENHSLPSNMITFDLIKEMGKVKLPKTFYSELTRNLDLKQRLLANHFLFGRSDFFIWLKANIIRMAKMVHAMDAFIRHQPIRVIADYIETTIPGCISALLAIKYNLDYVNTHYVLMSDRSILPSRASYHLIWGNNYKKWLQQRAIPKSQMKQVGNLNFDYVDKESVRPLDFRKMLGIPKDHFIFTWTSQPFTEEVNQSIMEWLLYAAQDLAVTIVIRPHPSDQTDYTTYNQFENIVIPADTSLYEILSITDFLMTISSNTAIEAARLKKGIIVLQPPIPYHYEHHNNSFNSHLAKAGAGSVVHNHKQLKKEIQRLINNRSHRESIINKGQLFLKNTLITKPNASSQISDFLHRFIK